MRGKRVQLLFLLGEHGGIAGVRLIRKLVTLLRQILELVDQRRTQLLRRFCQLVGHASSVIDRADFVGKLEKRGRQTPDARRTGFITGRKGSRSQLAAGLSVFSIAPRLRQLGRKRTRHGIDLRAQSGWSDSIGTRPTDKFSHAAQSIPPDISEVEFTLYFGDSRLQRLTIAWAGSVQLLS